MFFLFHPRIMRSSTDRRLAERLSVRELEWIRDLIRGSVYRTQADLERVEELILAAAIREERRNELGCGIEHLSDVTLDIHSGNA